MMKRSNSIDSFVSIINLKRGSVHFWDVRHQTISNSGFSKVDNIANFTDMAKVKSVTTFTSISEQCKRIPMRNLFKEKVSGGKRGAAKERPKLGLALGGGGVRGLAHIGVLTAFQKAGITIDAIAGTSMGAIVAATYALNPNFGTEIFADIVGELKKTIPARLDAGQEDRNSFLEKVRQFIDVERFIIDTALGWGVLPATLAPATISRLMLGKKLEEGKIPVAVVAFDLRTGKKVVFKEGRADIAVQASSALPGFFPPVEYEDFLLADGGFVDLVPVGQARKLSVDLVVAVDVDQEDERVEIHNGLEAFLRAVDICNRHHKYHHLAEADLVIRPDFGEEVKTFAVSKAEICIAAGERSAEKAMLKIKRLLRKVE